MKLFRKLLLILELFIVIVLLIAIVFIIKDENSNALIAQGSVIFIDKGEKDGVQPGQVYSLYMLETAKTDPLAVRETELKLAIIGEIVVLLTEPSTSTVMVTKSKRTISTLLTAKRIEVNP